MASTLEERLYRSMKRIRRFEEVTAEIYPSDRIKSPIHLAIGQEQAAVAVCDLLEEGDWVGGSYRSHAMYLAKGGSMAEIMAEMYGKATGCCGGKGGSMHVISTAAGVIGSSAVVASQIPVAAGYALAARQAGRGRVVAVFLGDGATEEGCFYETLNFAALRRLPLLFVVENNGLAIHEPLAKRRAVPDGICRVAEALGVPSTRIADGGLHAIRDAAEAAVSALRAGTGPQLIEALVHRRRQHVGPDEDYDQGYRSRAEAEPWIESDPLPRLAARLAAEPRRRIDAEIEAEIAAAVRFAEDSPPPAPEGLFADVYA
ncbi:pyruvate dehydrogenase E1 component alpha subunit [Tistlia consotensis]|uniref:Pyruvate dehydrogenase E1 component alpha subunit n=1 Tax=Tistlia consotensis USBA 355 TaxID=560819 RepID=A0A1Y6CKH1_9PROT|nr:thiamine pyrophosphate-dependent dehydrogenase E1 component subunit alpha [Tistlia consotensis]SMF71493.1 pyruvate dehydrogenase E1 component alpha subunit [Tistlia consotensis USBA 355]SNS06570.1 pyruvate dehydrogenase E1 component alpha subunit [Tistlia consotensis]